VIGIVTAFGAFISGDIPQIQFPNPVKTIKTPSKGYYWQKINYKIGSQL